jgi:tetratricopeptide (TPR) repeat protein
MSRAGMLLLPILVVLLVQTKSGAQKPADPVATQLAVQAALQQGRAYLNKGQPSAAIEVLEAQLPFINGNSDYLGTLRDAYSAQIRELQLNKHDDQIPPIAEKLRLLQRGHKPDHLPLPPLDPPPAKARAQADPFDQQPLLDAGDARDLARRGDAAFAQGKYAEAARLFEQAHKKDSAVLGARTADWAYCRMVAVVERFKAEKGDDATALGALEREMTDAIALAAAKPELAAYGQTVLDRIRQRQGIMPVSAVESGGWVLAQSANFRLFHHQAAAQAQAVLQSFEKARAAAYQKWFGGAAADWTLRCDVYLHSTAADYTRATGKDARWMGYSSFEVVNRKVTKRRIDLVGDNPELLTAALPREATHVVLIDQFPDPMLPRWADEAMSILAEPRENVQRYLRALPRLAREHKLFPVGQLLLLREFPDAVAITAFYAQGVSLVDMLVAEKGPQTFTLFLQSAQRYGFERALKDSYGLKSFAALQDHWQRKAFAAD